jgi:aminopeptidase
VIEAAAYARLLCDWCIRPEAEDQVLVSSTTLAEAALRALHNELLDRGAWPILRVQLPNEQTDFYAHVREERLDSFPPLDLIVAERVDFALQIQAPLDPLALADVDPERVARAARARKPLFEARHAGRWCVSMWPTAGLAKLAGMTEQDYAAFLERALFLDQPEPVAAWERLSAHQAGLVERLSAVAEIRIEADGTDLRLRVDGRKWLNSDGRQNMPSGEVFTSPREDSANGRIRFTVPSSTRGAEVSGVELEFKDGEVISARAERGESYLKAALETDAGARRLGEIGIGANRGIDRPTGSTLLDEKMAGTVHLALGDCYPEAGGLNSSALHWDLVCDLRGGGRLSGDGEPLEVFPSG